MKSTWGNDNNLPAYELPFVIMKLIGFKPDQVASIHRALNHPAWNERREFFKHKARSEFQHEPEITDIRSPRILSSGWSEKHRSYLMEIRIPLFFLGVLGEERPFEDPDHRHLFPLTVLSSLCNAAGIFPNKETPVGARDTHGEMKITEPF